MRFLENIAKKRHRKRRFHYARIDSSGICRAVFRTDSAIERVHCIPVNSLDISLIGKRWIGVRWISASALTQSP